MASKNTTYVVRDLFTENAVDIKKEFITFNSHFFDNHVLLIHQSLDYHTEISIKI